MGNESTSRRTQYFHIFHCNDFMKRNLELIPLSFNILIYILVETAAVNTKKRGYCRFNHIV